MSLDAGGLAQITYNHNSFNGLGVPGSGFASRGKSTHIKRLSFAPPAKISTIDETQQANPNPTPRTSRSHLLAGLRTAPKSPTSAPPTQTQQQFEGYQDTQFANHANAQRAQQVPHTAVGTSFHTNTQFGYNMGLMSPVYSYPEQILAPPAVQFGHGEGDSQLDPQVYAELIATNQRLAQQQLRLQQQLANVTAAAQQFQGLNIGQSLGQQQYMQSPMTMNTSYYDQQLQNGLQPVIQAVPNQPGLYTVYNPMTGQQSYFMNPNAQQNQQVSPTTLVERELSNSPPPPTPTFRVEFSPPPESPTQLSTARTFSPLKSSSPPHDVVPLPPPSANAFRPGHKKAVPSVSGFSEVPFSPIETARSAVPKSAGFPQTPMTGTFGPGQARAGEHPVRQPRGPPPLDELIAKPTSKYEGSKNFATRQRRRAVHNLVRAGLERRTASRGNGSIDSAGSDTPASEGEITFSVSSDNDTDSTGSQSATLSSKPSMGSLRAAAVGAIGSERKGMYSRNSTGSPPSSRTFSDDATALGGKLVEIENQKPEERKKMPLLVLNSAEKRKSSLF